MIGLIRVLVADDHPLMLEALVDRLNREPGFEVVGAVSNGKTLSCDYVETRPDVVVVDQLLGEMSGAEACALIRHVDPSACVLIFSAQETRDDIAAAVSAGALGYVVKSLTGDDLCKAIRRVASGEPVFGAEATKLLMAELRNPSHGEGAAGVLSEREREVLYLVARGLSNSEVGAKLYISAHTVKTHLERICSKLGVRGRSAAVRRGLEVGAI